MFEVAIRICKKRQKEKVRESNVKKIFFQKTTTKQKHKGRCGARLPQWPGTVVSYGPEPQNEHWDAWGKLKTLSQIMPENAKVAAPRVRWSQYKLELDKTVAQAELGLCLAQR